jgi:hypothetical protein
MLADSSEEGLNYKWCKTIFRHVLPASLMNESVNASDSFYEEALSHGEPVIVYMHGNSGSRGSAHRIELYTLLRNMDCHVIAFDYRSKICKHLLLVT